MKIIFSQGPTAHSRLGNSLLWMARAFPQLSSAQTCSWRFPWSIENFSSYLKPNSAWLSDGTSQCEISALFSNAFGGNLESKSISNISRTLQSKYEEKHGLPPFEWKQILENYSINGFKILFCCGKNIAFDMVLRQSEDSDLTIIHEPFELTYAGPRFPVDDLAHIHPKQELIESAESFIRSSSGSNNLVGLHIRRGDYRGWQNGIHFHPDEQWISLALSHLNEGREVFVFGNEPESELMEKLFKIGCNISAGSALDDFVRMMFMDMIIGPPSTFTIVASMISKSLFDRSITINMLEGIKK